MSNYNVAHIKHTMLQIIITSIKISSRGTPKDYKRRLDQDSSKDKEPSCQCRRHKRLRFDPWVRNIPCSKKWHPTPVFLPGKFHGQRNLAGHSPWGCKEFDTIEATWHTCT